MTVTRREWLDRRQEYRKWRPLQIRANIPGTPGWLQPRLAMERAPLSRDFIPAYEDADPEALIEAARKGIVYADVLAPEPFRKLSDPYLLLLLALDRFARRHPKLVEKAKKGLIEQKQEPLSAQAKVEILAEIRRLQALLKGGE